MSSLLHAALPASIQSRIPSIPSIRRTVRIQAAIFRSDSTTTVKPALSSSTEADSLFHDQSLDRTLRAAALSAGRLNTEPGPRHKSRGSSADLGLDKAAVSPSQVNWKYGLNGFRTLESALQEAGDPDRLPELERQIYVESVAYLLRGLPNDLSGGELHQLRHATPDAVLVPMPGVPVGGELQPHQQQQQQQQLLLAPGPLDRQQDKSLPHAVMYWLVTRLYAFAVFLVPVATSLVQVAIELDRRYRLPEAMLAWSMGVLLVLYRNATELFATVCSAGDGRVGRALDEGTAYVASGVISGFREAVADMAKGKI